MAVYDQISDWYEYEFCGRQSGDDPLGIGRALGELLGVGDGLCLDIGCGTGVHAGRVRELGWNAIGVDISAGMLRHAKGRLPIAQADAQRLTLPGRVCAGGHR